MKKKQTSGLIIRLVDVVLILLFGFISISQLEKRSKVKLPESEEMKLATPDSENLLRVSVAQFNNDQWGFLVENDTQLLETGERLYRYLLQKKETFKRDVRVKIYAESTSPIKYTMQISDICEQMGLKKSLVVKLKHSQSGLQKERN